VKRSLLFVALLAGCGGPAVQSDTASEEPTPVAVELADVEQRDVRNLLPVDGSLILPEGASSKLAPGMGGKLVEIAVKEGDRVVAGQLLARVDARMLTAQSQSAEAGAASASASAIQTELALKASAADQEAAIKAARLAVDVALAEGNAGIDQASVELQRLRAGARPQEIAQAQQGVDQARIAREKAKLDADRDAQLFKEGLVAGAQADASQAALQTAESALRSAQSALDLVKAGNRSEDIRAAELRLSSARDLAAKRVDQARAALRQAEAGRLAVAAKSEEVAAARLAARQRQADAKAATAGIAMSEIRSPITGYVTRRFLNVGDVADTTTPVLAVSTSIPTVDFSGSVSPSEAARVLVGMRIYVNDLSGTVASVGEADAATGLTPIRAHLSGAARAGGFVTAKIQPSVLRKVATVPRGAVLSREGKDVVFVAKDGAARMTEVQLGPEDGGLVAVLKGVAPGAQVVVLGSHELSDGAKIEAAKEK